MIWLSSPPPRRPCSPRQEVFINKPFSSNSHWTLTDSTVSCMAYHPVGRWTSIHARRCNVGVFRPFCYIYTMDIVKLPEKILRTTLRRTTPEEIRSGVFDSLIEQMRKDMI